MYKLFYVTIENFISIVDNVNIFNFRTSPNTTYYNYENLPNVDNFR